MIAKTPDLPEFGHKLYVMSDEDGNRFIVEENENNEISRVDDKNVTLYLLEFIKNCNYALGMHKLVAKDVKNSVTEFLAYGPRIKEPPMVLTMSEPGRTYRKLPFDFESDPELARSPTFKEMMDRTTNKKALMAWIGSLFDENADIQQYVWIWGRGRNGKSALGQFLGDVLGPGARFVRAPKKENRFWTLQLIGKRLVIYGDHGDPKFVTDDLFKSMTGGDIIPAEIKGGAILQVRLRAKHLLFSNTKPQIDSGEADQRRIILCEIGSIVGDPDPAYQDRLWAEAATFLGECINVYLDVSGPRRIIPCEKEAAENLAHENYEFYDSVFHKCFVKDAASELPAHQFISSIDAFKIRSGPDIARFRQFVETQYGVKRERIKGAGFLYRGMRLAAKPVDAPASKPESVPG